MTTSPSPSTAAAPTQPALLPAPSLTVEHDVHDDGSYTVRLTPPPMAVLDALAQVLRDDLALRGEWRVLMQSLTPARRQMALVEVATDPRVRDALTVELAQGDAADLASALEPARCGHPIGPDRRDTCWAVAPCPTHNPDH